MIQSAVSPSIPQVKYLSRDSQAIAAPLHPSFNATRRSGDTVLFSAKPKSRGTVEEEKETKELNTIIATGMTGLFIGAIMGSVVPIVGTLACSIVFGTLGLMIGAIVNSKREKHGIRKNTSSH